MIILPSLASADQLHLAEEIERIRKIGRLHLDIEDGNFIDNITFGKKTISAVASVFDGILDAHLMTTNPDAYLGWLAELGVSSVCAHIEAMPYPMHFLRHAKALGMGAGLAINMKALPEELLPYVSDTDYVLVMTSEPDYGSQDFFDCAFERVEKIRSILPERIALWCDGGVRPEYLTTLSSAGVSAVVMGRAIFGADDPSLAVAEYLKRSAVY